MLHLKGTLDIDCFHLSHFTKEETEAQRLVPDYAVNRCWNQDQNSGLLASSPVLLRVQRIGGVQFHGGVT